MLSGLISRWMIPRRCTGNNSIRRLDRSTHQHDDARLRFGGTTWGRTVHQCVRNIAHDLPHSCFPQRITLSMPADEHLRLRVPV